MTDAVPFMLERGFHYNVFDADGEAVGYLVNQKLFAVSSGGQIGLIDSAGHLVKHRQRGGVVRGMEIVLDDGALLTLILVPF